MAPLTDDTNVYNDHIPTTYPYNPSRAGKFSLLGIKIKDSEDMSKLMSPLLHRSRKGIDGTPRSILRPSSQKNKIRLSGSPTVYVSPMEECNGSGSGSGSGSGGKLKVKDKNRRLVFSPYNMVKVIPNR